MQHRVKGCLEVLGRDGPWPNLFRPTGNKGLTRLWPGYFFTLPNVIFFDPHGKNWDFRGKFFQNQRCLTPIRPRSKIYWTGPITTFMGFHPNQSCSLYQTKQDLYNKKLTFLGPVLTSVHSTAVSFITSLGSSQETPKYIEMVKVWKNIKMRKINLV